MKTLQIFLCSLLLLLAGAYAALSADFAPEGKPSTSFVNAISVSPYATVGFENFDGKSRSGAGVDVGLGLSKNVSVVGFGEADDSDGSFVDRAGLGLQATAKLTKALSLWGRMSGAYNFSEDGGLEADTWFIRPQFGADLTLWQNKNWYGKLRASWGLDVDLHGNANQRLFGGAVLGKSF